MRPIILATLAAAVIACQRGERSADTDPAAGDSTSQEPRAEPGAGTELAAPSALLVGIEPVEAGNAPADILLTDPTGRRAGRDPRVGFSMSEVAGASYDSVPAAAADPSAASPPLARQLTVPSPSEGAYEILVVGTRAAPYTLRIQLSMPDGGQRATAVQGLHADRNQARRFRFRYAASDTGAIVLTP